MTNHRCGLPSPEAKKIKSSSRFAVSNVMASVGPRDAVEPHAIEDGALRRERKIEPRHLRAMRTRDQLSTACKAEFSERKRKGGTGARAGVVERVDEVPENVLS